MTLHKLTAGDGYTYLTRQVAAFDATVRGRAGLGDYYAQRGESPGRWAGAGLAGLDSPAAGDSVGEEQMRSLFGAGRHPDAARLEAEALAAGRSAELARAVGALGQPFLVYAPPVNGFRARCAREFAAVNAAGGQPAGAPIAVEERARIRTDLARAVFADTYDRPPADARELSGFLARLSRPATTAVAGYDLTFSPVKSISALWAIAPREVAEEIEAAHVAAVADTLAWLEAHACFTRLGAGGVRQVETRGLIAAAFTHRDSRAGDPDLHTHVAVSNKVQTRDGRWRALDGRVLHKVTVAASERYDTRLEAELVDRLGVTFTQRPGTKPGHRPIREVDGVDPRLLAAWSSRRRTIEARRNVLAAGFRREHGRPPTPVEAIALAQQATLETRAAKHEPRSLAEQRAAWRREAQAVLGGPDGVAAVLDRALHPRRPPTPRVSEQWMRDAATRVIDAVSDGRATWQVWHLHAEAERLVRAAALAPGDVDTAVARIVETALSPELSIPLGEPDEGDEPAELRRSDGASVYTVAGARLYTNQAILDAEQLLVTAAGHHDGRRADPATVELALLEATANGARLNNGQARLVRELAGSGARLQLALAPAGAGKTTALATLARVWTAGGGAVLGLAPSAAAAGALQDSLGGPCDTLAKLVWSLDFGQVPAWVARIGPGTLVIIDEAGMAGTRELARAVEFVLGRGGSVRLVGDDRQLASVAAGGVLSAIAATHGAGNLDELVRFADPAEAAATAAVRAGDPIGLGFYLDADRVHVGDATGCAEQAYAAWAADRARGTDALLLAATRDQVAHLNARARTDRLAATSGPRGPEVALGDGTRVGAGDPIITRANNRALPITAVEWVKNGDRFTVTAAHPDGALAAVHTATGRRITLPAAYVAEHVQLGYAATVHTAQGTTAETCHTLLTGTEPRQLLYVALSRGRAANHLYLTTAGDGDPHTLIEPQAVCPPTATELLVAMLGRDGAQTSATAVRRTDAEPAGRLHQVATRYVDALRLAADHRLEPETAGGLENAAEQIRPGLTAAPAWPTLRGHLALLALAGTDPASALCAAATTRELDSAVDPAAVLDWRLDGGGPPGPLPWLPAVPTKLADDPHWGPYLAACAARVSARADAVAGAAGAMTLTTAPGWARPLLDPQHAALRAELAVWRAAQGVPDTDRRLTGPPLPGAVERQQQRRLDDALTTSGPTRPGAVWAVLADAVDPRIRHDQHWPALAERLADADHAGLDAAALWSRLTPHLVPATEPNGTVAGPRRPDWCATLLDQLSDELRRRLPADPAWPALVAAVTAGTRTGWPPDALVTAALAGLPADEPPGRTAEVLVFRIQALTDPAPVDTAEPLPADLQPPDDAHLLPDADDVADAAETAAGDVPASEATSPGLAPQLVAPGPFAPPADPAADEADYLLEEHFWATAAVSRARLIELNTQTAAFYVDRYRDSWAPGYLHDRLGTDLVDDDRFPLGHAPGGWTALTDHLHGLGATDEELLAAGLGIRARTGQLVDRFRDRLVLPVYDVDGAVRGFIARRSPADGDGRAGPKYLNTPATDLYRKGQHLYGLFENRAALAAGAVPAVVEGPLDAIALTLAGDGSTVGVAGLGAGLTEQQANLLRPWIPAGRLGVLVATDDDPAGRRAAERIFWQLTARGDDPRRLQLPAGGDPADLLSWHGAAALQQAITTAGSLADQLLDARLATARSGHPADVDAAIRDAAAVITALPPSRWLYHIDRVTAALRLSVGTVHSAVLAAGDRTASTVDVMIRARPASRRPGPGHVSPGSQVPAGPFPFRPAPDWALDAAAPGR
jgi:DNA primase catalytic core